MDTKQEEIIEEFAMFDEWLDKYEYLIGLGNSLSGEDVRRQEQFLIDGCQSRVWVSASLDAAGHMHFAADSDAIITKGIIALLIRVLDDRTPQEVLDTDLYFIDRIGLRENLSPTRSNGLLSMIRQMKAQALLMRNE